MEIDDDHDDGDSGEYMEKNKDEGSDDVGDDGDKNMGYDEDKEDDDVVDDGDKNMGNDEDNGDDDEGDDGDEDIENDEDKGEDDGDVEMNEDDNKQGDNDGSKDNESNNRSDEENSTSICSDTSSEKEDSDSESDKEQRNDQPKLQIYKKKGYMIWNHVQHNICNNDFIFNTEKKPKCISKYCTSQNSPNITTRGFNMYTFGSTLYPADGPYLKYEPTGDKVLMPRFLKNSRPTGSKKSQGYELLTDKHFLKFAKKMEKLLVYFINESDKNTNRELKGIYEKAKKKIPEDLRIGDTCFTQFAIVGGQDGSTEKHIDSDDALQIYYVSTSEKKPNDLVFYKTRDAIEGMLEIPCIDGTVICAEFDKIWHAVPEWTGIRYTLNFYTSKKILKFFKDVHPRVWKTYKESGYPIKVNNTSPMMVHNTTDHKIYLTWEEKSQRRQAINDKPRDAGYICEFLDRDKKHQSVNYLRSCVQDAILNCATQLEVKICKTTLLREIPPCESANIKLQQCFNAEAVKDKLCFKKTNLQREKGGPAYNLLQIRNRGVYLCLCNATYTIWPDKIVTERHAFVYNSGYRVDNKHWILGAIIDNRQNKPIFLIEEKDRRTKDDSRKVFDDFFKAKVQITNVYLVHSFAKASIDDNDNIELHTNKKQKT